MEKRGDVMNKAVDTGKKIKEDKYKILRMSLVLGNAVDNKEALDNFETAAREIDAMNNEEYLDSIDSKYYKTRSLDEEKNRLEDLIAFIEGRVTQREALKDDFYNVAGYELSDLDEIKDSDRLEAYKNRLKYIEDYLYNTDSIEKISLDKDKYQRELDKAYDEKDNSEENNVKLEKDLSDLFKKIVNDNTIILRNAQEIDNEISDINPLILESKKTLDIFDKSFKALKRAGISGREEKEYYSYVVNVRDDYYHKMERYFLLSLYRLIFVICSEFKDIYNKRNKIKEIMDDRTSLRANLEINEDDKLARLSDLLDSQYRDILKQEDTINNINELKDKVNDCEEKLAKYKEYNNRMEIVELLKEFSLNDDLEDNIKEPVSLDFDSVVDNSFADNSDKLDSYNIDEVLNEVVEEPVKDNQVVLVSEPTGIDIVKVTEKTKNVMIKVGQMLNPPREEKTKDERVEIVSMPTVHNPVINTKPIIDVVPKTESANNESNVKDNSNELNLPKFDDLPTVSSLTNQGSINPSNSNNTISTSSSNSFWGDATDDFEFPDINGWEG